MNPQYTNVKVEGPSFPTKGQLENESRTELVEKEWIAEELWLFTMMEFFIWRVQESGLETGIGAISIYSIVLSLCSSTLNIALSFEILPGMIF